MHESRPLQSPQKRFLKFSTVPIEAKWWRAEINAEDLRWIQQNLRHGLDGAKHFPTIQRHEGIAMALYPDCPWGKRVVFVNGERAPRVLIALGDAYNYQAEYSKSREARDPYLSPHGLFRRLVPDYHKQAMQFMRQFGPLFIDAPTRFKNESWWLSLSDFWDRHARFVAVAKLWEDRFDLEKLRANWTSIGEQHERLDRAGAAPLGYIPDPTYKYVRLCRRLPWEQSLYEREVLRSTRFLQQLVYELLHCELILHTQECVQTWTRRAVPNNGPADEVFEPTRAFTSLWGVIWELFGLDTRQYGWKLCECGRLFYPKDRRSVCCCTEHQSRWSKREWARRHSSARQSKRSRSPAEGVHAGRSTHPVLKTKSQKEIDSVHQECTLVTMPSRTENVTIWICTRCNHQWQAKDNAKPVRCAKCKSPYWDRMTISAAKPKSKAKG